MTTNYITKRPHKKSRAGCKTSQVSFEISHQLATPTGTSPTSSSSNSDEDENDYLSLTLINPMPPATMSSGNLSANDLRLMYHWSTFTYDAVGVGDHMHNVLRFVLPELAFENEFLLNGMLGIASLHRQKLLPYPGESKKETDLYRFKALSSFRKAVPSIRPDSPNYEAALVMSVLLVVLCSQDYNPEDGELTIVRWIVLYRGLYHIMMIRSYSGITDTSVFPIFTRQLTELRTDPVVPTILLKMLAMVDVSDPDYAELPFYCSILDALGMLYASLRDDGPGLNLAVRVVSWLSHGSDPFAKCAKENRPRALVILAHYLVFMKLVKGLWWYEGVADREIKAISNIVGPKYAPYMEVPVRAAEMTDIEEITNLMLSR
ncbi:hypothetical protein D0Z07_6063 [Hyphodiscus hymeniophilus]|uniref:Uncharacterized protein n=1 Tax=Hyphodiscus hymeniophilus TaxID=353542 RepID=A0A9P7AWD5_9HELO|nr:hypothetical protein D0Z07_6063 [Hyphodiscus hymeniophilus]